MPAETSLDKVHVALGRVVGRTTIQRIRNGIKGTRLDRLKAIASQLGLDVSELLKFDAEAGSIGERMAPPSVRQALAAIREVLDEAGPEERQAAGAALLLMAKAPDSEKVFEEAVALLTSLTI